MSLLTVFQSWFSPLGHFWSYAIAYFLEAVVGLILAALSLIIMIYLFRKYMARLQRRIGPNRVGKYGLLQLIADAMKLMGKEVIFPARRDDLPYRVAPLLVIFGLFAAFFIIPYGNIPYFGSLTISHSDVTVILLFAFMAIMPIGEVLAGISSKNKYSLTGAMRAVAKDISFEVPMMLSIIAVVLMSSARTANALNLQSIITSQVIPYGILEPLGIFVFFVATVARASHTPFDLGESESELVSGFSTEYTGLRFGLFYMGLFGSIFLGSLILSVFYLGGYHGPFAGSIGWVWLMVRAFILVLIFFTVWLAMPRIRIDKFMDLGWKYLLPISFINLVISGVLTLGFGW